MSRMFSDWSSNKTFQRTEIYAQVWFPWQQKGNPYTQLKLILPYYGRDVIVLWTWFYLPVFLGLKTEDNMLQDYTSDCHHCSYVCFHGKKWIFSKMTCNTAASLAAESKGRSSISKIVLDKMKVLQLCDNNCGVCNISLSIDEDLHRRIFTWNSSISVWSYDKIGWHLDARVPFTDTIFNRVTKI